MVLVVTSKTKEEEEMNKPSADRSSSSLPPSTEYHRLEEDLEKNN
jgi:hypothetical protein